MIVVLPDPAGPCVTISAGATACARRARQRDVPHRLRPDRLRVGRVGELCRAQVADLRPHQRAVDQVEPQDRDPRVVAARLEVAVEEAPREVLAAAVGEVHRREGGLAHHVDPAQPGVELDAVEEHDAAVDAGRVAEVQVAVALRARSRRCGARRSRPSNAGTRPASSRAAPRAWGAATRRRAGRSRRSSPSRRRGPARARRTGDRRASGAMRAWKAATSRANSSTCSRPSVPCSSMTASRSSCAKARIATAYSSGSPSPSSTGACGGTADRHDVAVELRGEPAVEPQLLLAIVLAQRERRVVDERELEHLLELVGRVARDQHVGDVRLDDASGGHAVPARELQRQRGHEAALLRGAAQHRGRGRGVVDRRHGGGQRPRAPPGALCARTTCAFSATSRGEPRVAPRQRGGGGTGTLGRILP